MPSRLPAPPHHSILAPPRPRLNLQIHQQQQSSGPPQQRTFSATPAAQNLRPKTDPLKLLPPSTAAPPPYPYPPLQHYKQRLLGLYGPTHLQFGNTVAPKHNTKTRRIWRPNIKVKHIHSRALGQKLRMRVATRVLRTIDKVGGVDEYVLGRGAARVRELNGGVGWRLRWAVADAVARRAAKQLKQAKTNGEGSQDMAKKNVGVDVLMGARKGAWNDSLRAKAEDRVKERLFMKYRFAQGAVRNELRVVGKDEKVNSEEWVDVDELSQQMRSAGSLPTSRSMEGHMSEERGELPIAERGVVTRATDRVLRTLRLRR